MSRLNIRDLEVSKWLNTEGAFEAPSGKVVAVHAFQMLCPGCVTHGVPQANKLHQIFNEERVEILGLHTVFEHHEAMGEASLKAFLHEFRVQFPVGIDTHRGDNRIPESMNKFGMQGTPTWLLFNKKGELVANLFGRIEDAAIASLITQLTFGDEPDRGLMKRSGRS